MEHNRLFQNPQHPDELNCPLADVTQTALEWGTLARIRVEDKLLREYGAAFVQDDLKGYYFVGVIVGEIFDVLHGRYRCTSLVSCGRFLAFDFDMLAERRRGCVAERLRLRVVYGPCDSDNPEACVFRPDTQQPDF